jgi:hypothetical protein
MLLITLALVHVVFPKYFNWRKELVEVSLLNKQLMYVHTFFIALTVFFDGRILLVLFQRYCQYEVRATTIIRIVYFLGNSIAFSIICLLTTIMERKVV